MSDRLPVLLAQLVPLAVVVAWSPVKILPPLALVFGATRPRATSLAFLAGSLAALVGAIVVFIGTPHLLDGLGWSGHGGGAWVRLVLGAVLLAFAVVTWMRRAQPIPAAGWLSGLTRISPAMAALLAVLLTVLNPKVMIANAAAGLAIGSAALTAPGTAVAVATYTALAGSTIIVPVVGYTLAADRVAGAVDVWKAKLARHQGVVVTVILAVLGAAMVTTGAFAL